MGIRHDLIELERSAWLALSTDGDAAAAHYEASLADEVLMLRPPSGRPGRSRCVPRQSGEAITTSDVLFAAANSREPLWGSDHDVGRRLRFRKLEEVTNQPG
jgi:hypothetical protein